MASALLSAVCHHQASEGSISTPRTRCLAFLFACLRGTFRLVKQGTLSLRTPKTIENAFGHRFGLHITKLSTKISTHTIALSLHDIHNEGPKIANELFLQALLNPLENSSVDQAMTTNAAQQLLTNATTYPKRTPAPFAP